MFRILAAAAGLLWLVGPAFAQPQACPSIEEMLTTLANKQGQSPVVGLQSVRGPLMVVVNARNGTWSLIAQLPNGCIALVTEGQGFMLMPPNIPHGQGDS